MESPSRQLASAYIFAGHGRLAAVLTHEALASHRHQQHGYRHGSGMYQCPGGQSIARAVRSHSVIVIRTPELMEHGHENVESVQGVGGGASALRRLAQARADREPLS